MGVHLSSGQLDLTQFWSWPWDTCTGGVHLSWVCLAAIVNCPYVVLLLVTGCVYGGSIWLKCKKDIWKFGHILGLGLASQRSFLWKTNKEGSCTGSTQSSYGHSVGNKQRGLETKFAFRLSQYSGYQWAQNGTLHKATSIQVDCKGQIHGTKEFWNKGNRCIHNKTLWYKWRWKCPHGKELVREGRQGIHKELTVAELELCEIVNRLFDTLSK